VTAETLQRRAEIERQISGLTLRDLLERIAREEGDAPAFSDEAGDGWQTLTWAQAYQRVLRLAAVDRPRLAMRPSPRRCCDADGWPA